MNMAVIFWPSEEHQGLPGQVQIRHQSTRPDHRLGMADDIKRPRQAYIVKQACPKALPYSSALSGLMLIMWIICALQQSVQQGERREINLAYCY
jgi:hypothetical protein